jgi:FixJ family two-component response regulator
MEQTVYIVDDDIAVRDSLALLLGLKGYRTACFASAEDFLATWQPGWSGCLILDLRMSGMDGLALQKELAKRGGRLPVLILTAHGTLEAARQAFRSGAVDFFEKPVDGEVIVAAVQEAFLRSEKEQVQSVAQRRAREMIALLSEREGQVLDMLAQGMAAREIGAALGISPRTVEVYKARLMEKTGARKLPDLVRLVMDAK